MKLLLVFVALALAPGVALAQTRPAPQERPGQFAAPANPGTPRIEIFVLEPHYLDLTVGGDLFNLTSEDRIGQEAEEQCRTAAGPVTGAVRALHYRLSTTASNRTPEGVAGPPPGYRYFKRLVCEVRY